MRLKKLCSGEEWVDFRRGGGGTTKETFSMSNSRSPEAGIPKFEINTLLTSAHLYRDSLSNIQNEFNIGIIIIVCSTRH